MHVRYCLKVQRRTRVRSSNGVGDRRTCMFHVVSSVKAGVSHTHFAIYFVERSLTVGPLTILEYRLWCVHASVFARAQIERACGGVQRRVGRASSRAMARAQRERVPRSTSCCASLSRRCRTRRSESSSVGARSRVRTFARSHVRALSLRCFHRSRCAGELTAASHAARAAASSSPSSIADCRGCCRYVTPFQSSANCATRFDGCAPCTSSSCAGARSSSRCAARPRDARSARSPVAASRAEGPGAPDCKRANSLERRFSPPSQCIAWAVAWAPSCSGGGVAVGGTAHEGPAPSDVDSIASQQRGQVCGRTNGRALSLAYLGL